ncbi:MAG TPA: MBL fold metallo-hydrolase [Microthrixaceae bacterium]|jgi:ribonuclease BN (tRNA processing enzyme)|nr:MBL fold metallo-hydrolase [Microthrixaceae bacterium]
MGFSVTVLGSGGTYAGVGNACSGFLLRTDTTTVMLDAGPGSFPNLQRHVDPRDLDAVVVSHSHPDHCLDLPVMRNAMKYVLDVDGLPLYTTAATFEVADSLASEGVGSTFAATVITDGAEFTVGDLRFRCSRTDHPVETLAFRVDHGDRSFAYTADTGPGWSLAELGPGIDLAISEATFLDGSDRTAPVHLSAHQAGEAAARAGVERLVITHVLPTGSFDDAVAEAADAYGAPVEAALPHRTFDV